VPGPVNYGLVNGYLEMRAWNIPSYSLVKAPQWLDGHKPVLVHAKVQLDWEVALLPKAGAPAPLFWGMFAGIYLSKCSPSQVNVGQTGCLAWSELRFYYIGPGMVPYRMIRRERPFIRPVDLVLDVNGGYYLTVAFQASCPGYSGRFVNSGLPEIARPVTFFSMQYQ